MTCIDQASSASSPTCSTIPRKSGRAKDALSYRSLFAKEPLIIGLICGKWHIRIRHPLRLRHPVAISFFAKEPLIIELFCRKWPTKIRHPLRLHHSVAIFFRICGSELTFEQFHWIQKKKSVWINKSLVNPKSTSNQSSRPCTVLQYPSKKICGSELTFEYYHLQSFLRFRAHLWTYPVPVRGWLLLLYVRLRLPRDFRGRFLWILKSHWICHYVVTLVARGLLRISTCNNVWDSRMI